MPRALIVMFATVFIVLGCALAVQTARLGGQIGFVLAALFVALGVGRLYLLWTRGGRG
jgi:hypothetical protein